MRNNVIQGPPIFGKLGDPVSCSSPYMHIDPDFREKRLFLPVPRGTLKQKFTDIRTFLNTIIN